MSSRGLAAVSAYSDMEGVPFLSHANNNNHVISVVSHAVSEDAQADKRGPCCFDSAVEREEGEPLGG